MPPARTLRVRHARLGRRRRLTPSCSTLGADGARPPHLGGQRPRRERPAPDGRGISVSMRTGSCSTADTRATKTRHERRTEWQHDALTFLHMITTLRLRIKDPERRKAFWAYFGGKMIGLGIVVLAL